MKVSDNIILHSADVCVIGGGMSGICAAVSAARHGSRVVLMHDRPVLGGNASSEIRMWIRGCAGKENRETGILQEIEFENIYRNPTLNFSIWDTVLYGIVKKEKNIELLLNCSCLGCETENEKISEITGWQLNSYSFHKVKAKIFIDCSGDSILAPLSGAAFRVGREGSSELDEYGAEKTPDRKTMGSSVLLQARETDHKCYFKAPEWAYVYKDDEALHLHKHEVGASGNNFWWIELGGEQDTINDAQKINEEIIKVTYGVWDHLKNQGNHGLDNWELEWIGFLPGKRESRRYEGPYILSQKDLEKGHHFEDAVAFGGWTMDNHSPLGFYYHGYSSHHIQVKYPYEIPFSCLYSKNISNLMFAGRNISATHMAMSSTRVMATCSVNGQAAGTGAAFAVAYDCSPDVIDKKYISQLQKTLLDDGCFIPGCFRKISGPECVGLDEGRKAVLSNGWERPHGEDSNCVQVSSDDVIAFDVSSCSEDSLRIVWDTDFSRESITKVEAYQKYAMRSHIVKDSEPLKMPAGLMKKCVISMTSEDGGKTEIIIDDNRLPMLVMPIPANVEKIEISKVQAWRNDTAGMFACDVFKRSDV